MSEKRTEKQKEMIGGVALIAIGLVALLGTLFDWDMLGVLILPALGLIFLVWGILSRESGFFIPGGILSGIGLGIVLIAGPLEGLWRGVDDGGIFMLAFAAGWVLIPLMSLIFTDDKHWWALIPAGIMALIGFGVLFGGIALSVLSVAGRLWPIVLITLGIYVIWQHNRAPQKTENN